MNTYAKLRGGVVGNRRWSPIAYHHARSIEHDIRKPCVRALQTHFGNRYSGRAHPILAGRPGTIYVSTLYVKFHLLFHLLMCTFPRTLSTALSCKPSRIYEAIESRKGGVATMLMKTGEYWHCTNPGCHCRVHVKFSGEIQGPNPRCVCGGLLKKDYAPPVLKYLDFLRAEKTVFTHGDPRGAGEN